MNDNHELSNCYCRKTLTEQVNSWYKLDQSQFTLLEIWVLIFSVFVLHASVTCIPGLTKSQNYRIKGCPGLGLTDHLVGFETSTSYLSVGSKRHRNVAYILSELENLE